MVSALPGLVNRNLVEFRHRSGEKIPQPSVGEFFVPAWKEERRREGDRYIEEVLKTGICVYRR
jgi:hypothetical protein